MSEVHYTYQVYGVATRRLDGELPTFEKMVGHNKTGETRIFFMSAEAQAYADQLNQEKGDTLFRVYSLLVSVEKEVDLNEIRNQCGGRQP